MNQLSLKGKRIVIARSAESNKEWELYLKNRGAKVYSLPTITTTPVAANKKIASALAHLDTFAWIIFTSAAAPRALESIMKTMHLRMPVMIRSAQPASARLNANAAPMIAAIGASTARAVRGVGLRVNFVPSVARSATLARELKPLRLPILLLRADIATKELPQALKKRSAAIRVLDIPIYKTTIIKTHVPKSLLSNIKNKRIDSIVFTSPSAVSGFLARLKGGTTAATASKAARTIPAIALGPSVATALRKTGFSNVRVANAITIEAIADAILKR